MPIGILASLLICTVLYIAVAVVLTGMAKWNTLGNAEPLAYAFSTTGACTGPRPSWRSAPSSRPRPPWCPTRRASRASSSPWAATASCRKWAAKVHPRFRTPHVTTIITGVVVALCSSVFNINELVELTNIGTLFAFILVALGIIILRVKDPGRPRPFRTPLVPWVPLGAVACCAYLMFALPGVTWVRFFLWMAVGLLLYFFYGFGHSRLNVK